MGSVSSLTMLAPGVLIAGGTIILIFSLLGLYGDLQQGLVLASNWFLGMNKGYTVKKPQQHKKKKVVVVDDSSSSSSSSDDDDSSSSE